jgi:repressor of nif and glnA expression
MRQRADWMTQADDTILEFLEETDAAFSKRALEVNFERENIELSYSTLKRRLPILEEYDLVEKLETDGAWYHITDEGLAYLAGDLDVQTLTSDSSRS